MKFLKIIWLASAFVSFSTIADTPSSPNRPLQLSKLIDMPAMTLGEALVELAEEFNVNLLISSTLLEGLHSKPLVGYYTLERALTIILEGTSIHFLFQDGNLSLSHITPTDDSHFVTPAATPAPSRMEEVIVSARLRDESKFDVPMSMSITTSRQKEQRGLTTVVGIGNQTSNALFKVPRGSNSSLSAYIRGLGQDDPLAGFESGVGVYVDDVYINRPQTPILDIYDISQVEILKGPQGTLYGRNTIGGAVKFVTAPLPLKPTSRIETAKGSYNQTDVIANISTPVKNQNIRVGASYADLNRDGFGKNRADGSENYDKAITASKLRLEIDSSHSEFRLGYDITRDESQPKLGHRLVIDDDGNPPLSSLYDAEGGLSFHEHPIKQNHIESEGHFASFKVQPTPYSEFFSITSNRRDDGRSAIDFGSTFNRNLDTHVEYKNKQFSQEFRLTLSTTRSSTVLGAYYLKAEALSVYDTGVDVANFLGISFSLADIESESRSVFVDNNFELNPNYSLSLGARITQDEHKANMSRDLFTPTSQGDLISPYFGGDGFSVATPAFDTYGNQVAPNFSGNRKDRAFTPRISLSRATDSTHAYILHSEGYKSGNFDPRADYSDPTARKGFGPEYLTSQEIGFKYLDNSINFELSAFQNDYRDIQIPDATFAEQISSNESVANYITNNASAKIYGIESQISMNFGSNYRISIDSGFLNGRYTDYISPSGTQERHTRKLVNAPNQTHALNIDYTHNSMNFGTLNVNFNLSYSNDFFIFSDQPNIFPKSSYHLYNLTLVWKSRSKKLTAGLYGKNLHDERVVVDGYYFPVLGATTAFYSDPRTFSVKLGYTFH